MLETIHLSHLPPSLPLYMILYHSVQNAPFLRQQLLAGNSDFEYAFIDASMTVSRTHILAACFRAMNDFLSGRLKSRNVHSEIVFALSPNNNIGEAFRKFGIQVSTTNLLVIKVPTNREDASTTTYQSVEKHLKDSVHGVAVDVTDETLSSMCDVEKVRKAYKIAPPAAAAAPKPSKGQSGLEQPEEQSRSADEKQRLERAILGAMALRGAT